MTVSSSDLSNILSRCQTGITAILRQPAPRAQQAEAIADLLLEVLPQAVVVACVLTGEGALSFAIRPRGKGSGSYVSLFESQLSRLNPLAADVQRIPAEALPDVFLLASALCAYERPRGFLVIGLPSQAKKEDVAKAEAMLTAAAPLVAIGWMLQVLQSEQAELARFALVGQAFIGLTHELNNALNSMMLQTSVVQLRVDEQARHELAAIRQHGAQAAGLVRSLQHVVQERREQSYIVDLNTVLSEVLEEESKLRSRVSLSPGPNASPIRCTRSAVKQLVRLLLEGVCVGTEATVEVTTGEGPGGTVLSVTIAQAESDASTSEALLWQNLDEVGRLAGQSLLRQLGGTLTAERTDDALILRVIWK
jgi:signal transduction histidine kinase